MSHSRNPRLAKGRGPRSAVFEVQATDSAARPVCASLHTRSDHTLSRPDMAIEERGRVHDWALGDRTCLGDWTRHGERCPAQGPDLSGFRAAVDEMSHSRNPRLAKGRGPRSAVFEGAGDRRLSRSSARSRPPITPPIEPRCRARSGPAVGVARATCSRRGTCPRASGGTSCRDGSGCPAPCRSAPR